GGPFDKRYIVAETPSFASLQTCAGEDLFGRAAKPALGEDRQATPQTDLVNPAKVETVVADFQKVTVGLRTAENRDPARAAADRRASLFEQSASGVPEPGVRIVRVGDKRVHAPRKDQPAPFRRVG